MLVITSCSHKKEPKKWTQEQRLKYMKDCISGAKKADKDLITKVCICAGKKIEEKYSYNDAYKISKEEKKKFLSKAVKECVSKKE